MEKISEKNIENRNLLSEKAGKVWQIRMSVIFVLYTVFSGILFFVGSRLTPLPMSSGSSWPALQ